MNIEIRNNITDMTFTTNITKIQRDIVNLLQPFMFEYIDQLTLETISNTIQSYINLDENDNLKIKYNIRIDYESWSSLYPKLTDRIRAYSGFLLHKIFNIPLESLEELKWYHGIFLYKIQTPIYILSSDVVGYDWSLKLNNNCNSKFPVFKLNIPTNMLNVVLTINPVDSAKVIDINFILKKG